MKAQMDARKRSVLHEEPEHLILDGQTSEPELHTERSECHQRKPNYCLDATC